jgi:hypothetical protein
MASLGMENVQFASIRARRPVERELQLLRNGGTKNSQQLDSIASEDESIEPRNSGPYRRWTRAGSGGP